MDREDNPFSIIKYIKRGQFLTEDKLKIYMPFLANKMYYYSGFERFANLLNHLWMLPKEWQYKLSVALFKGRRTKKWIKKGQAPKYKDVIIRYLMAIYECSSDTAKQYYEFLSKEDIRGIEKVYE